VAVIVSHWYEFLTSSGVSSCTRLPGSQDPAWRVKFSIFHRVSLKFSCQKFVKFPSWTYIAFAVTLFLISLFKQQKQHVHAYSSVLFFPSNFYSGARVVGKPLAHKRGSGKRCPTTRCSFVSLRSGDSDASSSTALSVVHRPTRKLLPAALKC